MNGLDQPIRRSRKLSMTPMIDVVFLLLIFFMLINTFGATQVLRFATPSGERKSAGQDFALADVLIRADGGVMIDGVLVPESAFSAEMQKIKSRAAEVTLVVSVEPGATIQPLIYVVEAARNAGLKNIAMKKKEAVGEIIDPLTDGDTE